MLRAAALGLAVLASSLVQCGPKTVSSPAGTATCGGCWVRHYWVDASNGRPGGDRSGVEIGGKLTIPVDYRRFTWINESFALGVRFEEDTVDLLRYREGKVVRTRFTSVRVDWNDYGMTLLGASLPDAGGRREIVVLDADGREFSTFYAEEGKTHLHVHGNVIVLDSVDEQGKPFSSIHDRTGLPISPRLAPLVHTQYVSVGRHRDTNGYESRLPRRLRTDAAVKDVFATLGNQPTVLVGTLPAAGQSEFEDRRILRPVLGDGSLAPIPPGAIGYLPLHLFGDYSKAWGVGYAPMHARWAVVYPTAAGFRYAVGDGDIESIAMRAKAGALPVYDGLRHFADTKAWDTEIASMGSAGGAEATYAVRVAGEPTWSLVSGETWQPIPEADNGGKGYPTWEAAALEPKRRKEELERAQAAERARIEREREAALQRAKEAWEADRPRREALERERQQRLAELERQREAARQERIPKIAAQISSLPAYDKRDVTRGRNQNVAWVLRNVRELASASLWEAFLDRYGPLTFADITDARRAGVRDAVLERAQQRLDEVQQLRAWVAAAEAQEEAQARAEAMRWTLTDWPSSVPSGGMEYLNKIGYESMVKQNTQAWAGGANPWGRSWAK